MIHRIHCQEPWFSLIRSGKKPVEGRKGSPAYRAIKAGDTIEFFCFNEKFICQVTGVNRYKSLEEYLVGETLERALPGVVSLDKAISIYLQWSTREQVVELGFLGIQIKV